MSLVADLRAQFEDFSLRAEVMAEPGQTTVLLGPNGAGKTTSIRAVLGLMPLDAGSIMLEGRVLDDPGQGIFVEPHDRSIGAAFQDNRLFPHLSVADNIGFGLARSVRRPEVAALLKAVGLAGSGSRSVAELSGGQAKRVAIARALAGAPALVVLDEPFAGLDVDARHEVRRLIVDRRSASAAPWLIVTHDATEARTLADRIIVLESGQVSQVGSAADVQQRPASRYVANVMGVNLFEGVAADGRVQVGPIELTVVDTALTGRVRLTAPPEAVALYRDAPGGSPRNAWAARVGDVHRVAGTSGLVRVHLDEPVPLVADITEGAVTELGIAPGAQVWVAIKATSLTPISSDLASGR